MNSDMFKNPQRPSIRDVHALLKAFNGLIVHFSGCPKGAGKDRGLAHLYPNDLKHVINGHAQGGISCSIVRPGDCFVGTERNATGCIGVIVDLVVPESIVGAQIGDGGSGEDESGNRSMESQLIITADDLRATLNRGNTYNEWVIANYRIFGILAVYPGEVSTVCNLMDALGELGIPEEAAHLIDENSMEIGIQRESVASVKANFPGLPVYTFKNGDIYLCDGAQGHVCPHSDLYR